jgi:DNA-binding FadR family transcriptional regulator
MPRNDFHAISRRKLRDGVVDQLLAAIEGGSYVAGAALPSERELMAQMGVGRPAVREALLALEQRGLVAIAHGKRARVLEPDPLGAAELARRITLATTQALDRHASSADDLTEARRLFETTMVRLAAERATPGGIALLKRALLDNRRAISDSAAYLATDMALHRNIAALAGNPLCTAVGDALFTWLPRFRMRMVHVDGANLLSHDEHARIVERIAARDPAGAVTAIEAHLARSHSLYDRLGAGSIEPTAARSRQVVRSRTRGRGSR